MKQHIEMLSTEQVTQMWPVLKPLYAQSCESNEISQEEMTPEEIYELAVSGVCAIFVYYENDVPKLTLAFQFSMCGREKHAEIIAMAGESLMRFRQAYWAYILDWLRQNKVQRLGAYGNSRVAEIYRRKFGFDKSCDYVRMSL